MKVKESTVLQPLVHTLLAVSKYEKSRGEDAPSDLRDMKSSIYGLLGGLAIEGTVQDRKAYLREASDYITSLHDDPEMAHFMTDCLFSALVASDMDDGSTPSLTKIGEQMEMRDYAMEILAPLIEKLTRWGHPLDTNEKTCITSQFCLVTNTTAILRSEDGLMLYQGEDEPVKIDLSEEPHERDDNLKIAKIFQKVVTGEYKLTDCAKEIVKVLEWKPRDIMPFNHV